MVKIIEMLIPASNKKTRPGTKMNPTSVTIHETDNTNVRANALAHARLQQNGNSRQASWHLSVDDEPEVYQSLPFNEVGYHAGTTSGNYNSIGMEICVNSDGDYKKAVNNAIQTVKWLLNKYPSIKAVNVVQHNHWSGKNCPRNLRSGAKGIKWNAFIKAVRDGKKVEASKPAEPPKYTSTTGSIKVGQKVTLKKSAKNYATGESIPSQYKGKSYTVQQRGSNRVLLKELYSWVKTSDISGAVASKPKPKPTATASGSVVDWMKSQGMNSSYANRKKLAGKYGIRNYEGTAKQNGQLLAKLKAGKSALAAATKKGNQTTSSIVDYLKSINVNSGFANRKKLAAKHGIKNYSGTAAQNAKLLKKMRG